MQKSVCYTRTLPSFTGKANVWSCMQVSLKDFRRMDRVLVISRKVVVYVKGKLQQHASTQ